MKKIRLGTAVFYSRKRGKFSQLSLDGYVTTDNLLPNKAGVSAATNLPPKGESFPRYYADDILISNIRPYLKKIWFSNRTGTCSSDVLVLSANKGFNPRFVYYSILRDEFFEHVMKGAKGTKMPRGDKDQILEYPIPDFLPAIQDKIANLLSVIDSKIELNNKVNDNLFYRLSQS